MSEKPTYAELAHRIRRLEKAGSECKGSNEYLNEISDLKVDRDISRNLIDAAEVIILALNRQGEIVSINKKGR